MHNLIEGIFFGIGFGLVSLTIEKGIPLLYKKIKRKRRKAKRKPDLRVLKGGANG